MKKLLKYIVLLFLGYLILEPMLIYGDYCRGLPHGIRIIFFGGLLILFFVILTIVNLYQHKKRNQNFDFIPLLLTITIFSLFYILSNLNEPKFWTEKTLTAMIEVKSTPRNAELFLYKNGTFAATLHSADFSCTYQGEFELIDDQLQLKRLSLENETEKVFTTKYEIDQVNNKLIPIDESFGFLDLRYFNLGQARVSD